MSLERDEGAGAAGPSDAVDALLQRALHMAEDGEWDRMAELLRESLEEHAEDPHVLCWLGVAERELGLEGIAYERFKRALEAEPGDPILLATAGTAIAAFDDPAAEGVLRTAAMTAPELPETRWRYGAYLSREGLVEKALGEFEAAAALDPDSAVIQLEWGVALALSGRLEEAAGAFARAAELNPEDGWSLVLLGLARFELGEGDEAARALEAGARLRSDDPEAQALAALALAAEGWPDRALEMLERARFQAEGVAEALVLEVEERMEEGAEAVLSLLGSSLGPSCFRERLMQRP